MDINREISFRGRTHWARADWSKKGIKNVITFYLNKIGKDLKEAGYWYNDTFIARMFILIDFHEWLHIFIRRESRLKNAYIVTSSCENFIKESEEALCFIMPPLTFPDSRVDMDLFMQYR